MVIDSTFEQSERYIDCAGVRTFVRIIGEGPPVMVVHGGPGFSHDYLVSGLEFLSKWRKLIFYDQPGCGRTEPPANGPTTTHTFQHFKTLSADLIGAQQAGVIAHSWGATVYIAGQSENADGISHTPLFKEGVLINPAPIAAEQYSLVYQKLMSNIPSDKLEIIKDMLDVEGERSNIINCLTPYYSKNLNVYSENIFIPLTTETYKSITCDIENIHCNNVKSSVENLSILIGEYDYAGIEFISEITKYARRIYEVSRSAHFPFIENSAQFEAKVRQLFA